MPDENAATSTATEEVTAPKEEAPETSQDRLDSLSSEERATWSKTGEFPEPKKDEAPKEEKKEGEKEEPPKGEAPESELKAKPAESDPAKPEPKTRGEKRVQQLDSDIQNRLKRRSEVRQEIETLERQRNELLSKTDVKPEPSTAPAKPERPKLPREGAFETVEEFEKAVEVYESAIGEYGKASEAHQASTKEQQEKDLNAKIQAAVNKDRDEQRQAAVQDEAKKQNQATEQSWRSKESAAKANHPNYDEVVTPEVIDSIPERSTLDAFILEDEQGAEVLFHLGENRDEIGRIAALKPFKAHEALLAIKSSLSEKKAPPPKKTTAAPAPGREITGRATPPGDEEAEAVKSGDVAKYMQEANKRELRERKGI